MLDMLGVLESFADVFDVERYLATKKDSLAYLVLNRDSPTLRDIYEHFARVEPSAVKQAAQSIRE